MCGICGFTWANKNLLKKMINTLKHRGPDDTGYYIDDKISIGHTRLSIIDLTEKGRQPIHNEDNSIWISFNGEIYNYNEIRKELIKKGHNFYTNTDTEVIIHAYEEYEYDCVNLFNGQFAFCIYDQNKNEIFLARDRFGIKPLYYYHFNGTFIFASELKTLLQYELKKEINKEALNQLFTFRYTIAPDTILKNIYKLKPSHFIRFNLNTNQFLISKYFTLNKRLSNKKNIKELTSELFKLINDSVRLRMIADVPVCCFLSGGIDSSILTGLASNYNTNINTFSVGFETSSELKYAKIVSDYFNTNHHELIVKNEDFLENFNKMLYYMDEPIGDAAFFPTLLISKLVSKQFKVVLAGEGSDEVFGGYDKYKLYYYGKKFSQIIPKLNYKSEILNRMSKFSNLNENLGYLETIRVFNSEELEKMDLKSANMRKFWSNDGDLFQKMQYFDINTVLPEDFFMKADKMSSAYGLEERVPYMDHRIVSFGLQLPNNLKLFLLNEKYILKKTFLNYLPKVIINRKKRGYNAPMDSWFKSILKYRFLELINEKNHNLYKKEFALMPFAKILNSDANYKKNFLLLQKCWTIFIFEEWYKQTF
ncbi:MAG: asparagine synthase (glutamine-hydrolyzing) [Promethearchaeota archaeon]